MLTVAPPTAFGFLGNNPAAITIQGSRLRVNDGKTLSVVGGDMTMAGGSLQAPCGRLQLASVTSPGEAMFSRLELAPDLQVDSFARLGRMELSKNALLDVSGNGSGTVLIRTGGLLVDQSQIFATTLGDVDGAKMGINLRLAEDISVDNSVILTGSAGRGNVGEIRAEAGTLTLREGRCDR